MWPYWIMFLVPAFAAMHEYSGRPYEYTINRLRGWDFPAICSVFTIALLVGYRYNVGGDWLAYQRQFGEVQGVPLADVFTRPDPGYVLLNWISASLDWDIFGVNLVCGVLFGIGLLRFCAFLPRPWLGLTVAVPYMLVVVAMGYSRQAVALGFCMLGLVALKKKSTFWFVAWVLLGATFHKTAVMLLPIGGLVSSRNRFWSVLLAGATTYLGYIVLLQDSFDDMYANYVGSDMQSQGALVRLLMNTVPSVMLLIMRKRFRFTEQESLLWRWIALISLTLLGALFVAPSASTAVDRMALYMLPIQLVVFSHFPGVFGDRTGRSSTFLSACVVAYSASVLGSPGTELEFAL